MVSEELINLVAEGAGAGFSGTIVGLVKQFIPNLGVSDDLITGILGFIIYKKTSGMIRYFGRGMLIASISWFLQSLASGQGLTIGGTIHKVNLSKSTRNNMHGYEANSTQYKTVGLPNIN